MKFFFYTLLIATLTSVLFSCSGDMKKVEDKTNRKAIHKEEEIQDASEIISAKSLGLAYIEENDLDKAENQFKRLITLAPNDPSGYANLGVVYLRQAKYDLAEKNLQKAIELSPDDPDIRLNLAKLYELKDNSEASLNELKKNEELSPNHVKTLYSIAEKYEGSMDAESINQWGKYMNKIVKNTPKNIVARIYLIEALIRDGKADEALKNLEETQQIYPDFPEKSQIYFDQAMELLQNKKPKEALTPMLIFHNFLKLTPEYQGGIRELKGPQGANAGIPVISMTRKNSSNLGEGESILDIMKFVDATSGAGLDFFEKGKLDEGKGYIGSMALGDMDGDGDHDIYYSGYDINDETPFYLLLQSDFGRYKDITATSGISHYGLDNSSRFVDYDNDGFLDLFICNGTSNMLYRNVNEAVFENTTNNIKNIRNGNRSLFLDLDHEGDLDLVIAANNDILLHRNNGDGTFSTEDTESQLSKSPYRTMDMEFGDLDSDGDIDIIIANENGPCQVFSNLRQGKFVDVSAQSGIDVIDGSKNIEVADIDNDGDLDIILSSQKNGLILFENDGNGAFGRSEKYGSIGQLAAETSCNDIKIFDFDNDGLSDLLITGIAKNKYRTGTILLHNTANGFEDATFLLPSALINGQQIALADYNQDGDIDIFLIHENGGVKLLRNDGGNANRHLKLQLVGLRTGSSKNNYFGIGATVEVRAGDLYQMKMITEPGLHFGLGQREKADVVRIIWTNGVAQNIFSPGTDQDLIEKQELKGSCPFLYTWNGEEYVFVKDMMWRSALGMPLGIMGDKQAYAFANASQEYLKIPGELLLAQDGKYTIQVTEELWETIYADEIKLIAVDHPANAEIYVDEKFTAPPYPELKVYKVRDHKLPVSARDEKGNDLLQLISEKDHQYISNFQRSKYQGITAMKDLILDLGDIRDTKNLHLFMNGWIFPTDASINVALSQSNELQIKHPSLEVINKKGDWQEVVSSIGFPSGKNKTVIVDLSDKFLSKARKVRIRTNMEIYWDYIFIANDEDVKIEMRQMTPESADYHYRGFSAKSRKGGRYGPHWFDYNEVTNGQKWRDLTGTYTRYGDVVDLLQQADDQYIIANAGDETTISFDATKLPKLKDRWKRDFLIYSIGWVKDGDLNTALGQTVEPLPFHGMSKYPYGDNEHYPTDKVHQEYQRKYNIREIGTNNFKEFVKQSLN